MKKILSIMILITLTISLASCVERTDTADNTNDNNTSQESDYTSVSINASPDKYTWYIKNYVGKNCASLGYTSMGGDRLDKYGAALVKLIFVTQDGSYVNFKEENTLKEYVVTGQNISPNSEMKLTFQTDSNGEEYDNLTDSQTYEEIVLSVKKVNEKDKKNISLTEIKPSPDKYTRYIADYVGRNLADCGYTSMAGDRRDKYGAANIKLILIPDDGSYIDIDEEVLKDYVVTNQSVAPNTELNLVFSKDSNGIEYSNLVSSQNIEEIELYLKKISK